MKAQKVGRVFDSVAERYDVMNDLMSLGLHRVWKAFAISVARPRAGERILDIASGSGDLVLALARRVMPGGEVWISDINRRMLERGRDRLLDRGLALPAVQCDAERLPFPGAHFDCITVGFGLRNMTHKERALAEMARVARPGGRVLVLEFSKPWKPLPIHDSVRCTWPDAVRNSKKGMLSMLRPTPRVRASITVPVAASARARNLFRAR